MVNDKKVPKERRMNVVFFGQEYTLTTSAPQEEVEEIVRLVHSQFSRLTNTSSSFLSEKIAVLTCLNMAGDFVRLKQEFEEYKKSQSDNVANLTKRIESYLELI